MSSLPVTLPCNRISPSHHFQVINYTMTHYHSISSPCRRMFFIFPCQSSTLVSMSSSVLHLAMSTTKSVTTSSIMSPDTSSWYGCLCRSYLLWFFQLHILVEKHRYSSMSMNSSGIDKITKPYNSCTKLILPIVNANETIFHSVILVIQS
jgi:hypothetical protein